MFSVNSETWLASLRMKFTLERSKLRDVSDVVKATRRSSDARDLDPTLTWRK